MLVGLALDFGAPEQKHQSTRRANHAAETGGHIALPVRPRDQVAPGLVAGGARADVVEVVGAHVDQLKTVVAPLHRRHLQYLGFAAQVEQGAGIEGVVVGRHHFVVLRAEQAWLAVEPVERQFGGDGAEHLVVLDGGEGKHISLLRQRLGLRLIEGRSVNGAQACAQGQCGYPVAHGRSPCR
ncbi:hypothetical protein D3C76_1138880 [compost metagenome]